MKKIPLEKPENTFEKTRFEAQLKELGLKESIDTEEITEKQAKQFVEGGFETVKEYANYTGKLEVIDQEDLSQLTRKKGRLQAGLLSVS